MATSQHWLLAQKMITSVFGAIPEGVGTPRCYRLEVTEVSKDNYTMVATVVYYDNGIPIRRAVTWEGHEGWEEYPAVQRREL
jgi:hypothetical protein